MATTIDKEVLLAAEFSSLVGVGISAASREFRAAIDAILGLETLRLRKTSSTVREMAEATLDAYLGDLLKASLNAASEGFMCRSMTTASFNKNKGSRASYRAFSRYHEGLKQKGLIEVIAGFLRREDFDGYSIIKKGQLTRIRATPLLLQLASQSGVDVTRLAEHYSFEPTLHDLVRVKADGHGIRAGARLFPEPTPLMHKLFSELKEINLRLSEHEYSLPSVPVLHRVFNQGDAKDFNFDRGGRLSTSDGSDGFQQLPSAQRLDIKIDGEPVVEIDIKASHPTILYALSGRPLPERDLYAVSGLPRELVKTFVVVMIGSGTARLQRWPKGAKAMLLEALQAVGPMSAYKLNKEYPLNVVVEKIVDAIPPLALLRKGSLDWAQLQYKESEILIAAMLRCSRELGVPALPVHDSIIVPQRVAAQAEAILKEEFERFTGYRPATVVNTKTP